MKVLGVDILHLEGGMIEVHTNDGVFCICKKEDSDSEYDIFNYRPNTEHSNIVIDDNVKDELISSLKDFVGRHKCTIATEYLYDINAI